MSWFTTFEAKVVLKTPLPFFRGEFLDSDGIDIHGIWVLFFLGVVVIPAVLEGNKWVISPLGNFICPFPNLFEMKGLLVPFLHGGWDNVHGVNSSHKLGRDSSGKEIDQDILVGDSTKGSVVFKFWDIVENIEFVIDLGGG